MSGRAEKLLVDIRRATGNENIDGIPDVEFVRYLNDAQQRLHSLIVSTHPNSFRKQYTIDTVNGQTAYDLPTDVFMDTYIHLVEKRESNSEGAYYPLQRIDPIETNRVHGYFIRDKQIILSSEQISPVSGGLRVTYTRKLKDIEIRRGTITSLSPLTINNQPTGTDFAYVDEATIVDKYGDQVVTGIEVTSYNSGTGIITTPTSLTGAATGQFVVYGGNSTTHHEWPDVAERYLFEYCCLRINHRDSSADWNKAVDLLNNLENDLVALFAGGDQEVKYPTIVSTEFLDFE